MAWLELLRRFWWALPMAGLAVALGVQSWRLSASQDGLEAMRTARAVVQAKLDVTQSSLDGALSRIQDNNRIAEERAKRLEADRLEAVQNAARLEAQYEGTSARVRALEASSRAQNDPCRPSDLALDTLKDF